MAALTRLARLFSERPNGTSQVLIVGDSHVDGLKRACKIRGDTGARISFSAYRFTKIKNGMEVGQLSFERVLEMATLLAPTDLLAVSIGGNEHNILGLVQHPVPFDVFDKHDSTRLAEGAACIPYTTLWDFFETWLMGKTKDRFSELRRATKSRLLVLAPPPPKRDESHILSHPGEFEKAGILEHGISPAPLRAKLWLIQVGVLRALCETLEIGFVPPPLATVTTDGFLEPQYSADDATHANANYGELVLRQLQDIALTLPADAERRP